MKKDVLVLILLVFSLVVVAAEPCDINATLLNQDPYPAVPGDYVKIVFQIENLDNPECGEMVFTLLEEYPIRFNPGETGIRNIGDVSYLKDYKSTLLLPYEVRVDDDALDGANPLELIFVHKGMGPVSKTFYMEVEDVKVDFEIYVKDYDYRTNEITLEVLNIEKSDIEALAIEIPKQDIINVKGANRVVVGDLDSNEYTTAEFEAIPSDGEFIVNLVYSDAINVRRTVEKTVKFDSSYFINRKADQKTTPITTYIIWAVIAIVAIWWIVKKIQKKKHKKH